MHIEARTTTPASLDALLDLPVDAIGLGQEGCAAKLPDSTTLRRAADRIRATGRDVTVVLPAAWQRSAEALVTTAVAVAGDGPVTLSVNDIGTLLALAGTVPEHTTLTAGLALTQVRVHSATEAPHQAGTADVDIAGLEVLSVHGVSTAEIDSTALVGDELADWRLRRVLGAVPLGWSRSCPTARHHQLAPPDCTHTCDTPITITAHQRWVLNHGHHEAIPVADRGRQPTLTVFGNGVYLPTDTTVPVDATDVVLDTRFVPTADLPDLLGALRRPLATHH